MGAINHATNEKPYLTIVQGKIRQSVEDCHPLAQTREYELPDGTKGTKYEIVHDAWAGVVQGIEIKEGNYGKQCIIELSDANLALSVDSDYFVTTARRLPGADLSEEYIFKPYDFADDSGKKRRGISISINNSSAEKLKDFYYDGKKNINGFPKQPKKSDEMDKDDWKQYFQFTVKKFLVTEMEKIGQKLLELTPEETKAAEKTVETATEVFEAEDTIKPEDLPF